MKPDTLINLSKADNLIVSKSTLAKWSASGTKHPEIFERLGGRVFVNVTKLNKILSGKIKEEKE